MRDVKVRLERDFQAYDKEQEPMPALTLSNIKKSFGATAALCGVSLSVEKGEVHALIGENGAGKSTLMKILSGALHADSGTMNLDGSPYLPRDPQEARRSGVAMIYQELNLAPDLSVAENIALGMEPSSFGFLNRPAMNAKARRLLDSLGRSSLSATAQVGTLSIAERQLVEIARALASKPRVLILDEPTSSLSPADSIRLFEVIERLSMQGVSIIYISHFLEECRKACSHFTVLRDGESVGTGLISETTDSDLVQMMVGRTVSELYPRFTHVLGEALLTASYPSEPRLKTREKKRKPGEQIKKPDRYLSVNDVHFSVRAGEVFGLFGLIGAGRTELLRKLFGLDDCPVGNVAVFGREDFFPTPSQRLEQGMGLLSEDRKGEGLMLNRTLAENLTLSRPVSRMGFLSKKREQVITGRWMEMLEVRANNPSQVIGELSGGNQQKIAIARLLHHEARVFLLDEPTRGIDVGSKVQIYRLISDLASEGRAIIFVSSYIPELLGICDTVAVMRGGKIVSSKPVVEWSEHTLMEAALGATFTPPPAPVLTPPLQADIVTPTVIDEVPSGIGSPEDGAVEPPDTTEQYEVSEVSEPSAIADTPEGTEPTASLDPEAETETPEKPKNP